MTYTQSKAEAALDTRLQENFSEMSITFANIPYEPSVEEPYVRVNHIPGLKYQASLGKDGWNRIEGTMFLYVSYPTGAYVGTYDAHRSAEQLVALFERGTTITYDDVQVTTTRAQRVGAIADEARYTPVVEISWYAYVSRDTLS